MDPKSVAPASIVASYKELARALMGAGKSHDEVVSEVTALAEKCGYAYESSWVPFAGATSFDEYDSYQQAATQEAAVYELTYAFQSVVSNILKSEMLSLADKASAVRQASIDLASRIPNDPRTTIEQDEGDDELEEMGMRSIGSRLWGTITGRKAQWDTAFINDLPDSAFAIIMPGGEKDVGGKTTPRSLRKLPHHDSAGKVDAPHMRNAMSRLPQTKGLTDAQRTKAENHLAAHQKAMKSLEDHEPLPAGGSFRAFKDASGAYRWAAIYSNNFEDLEGEIFPYESHKEFVDWVDRTGSLPELWLWHTPGTKVGSADAIDLSTEGFLVALGTFDEGSKDVAARLEAMGPQAVSHGYNYEPAGLVNGVYTKEAHYRTFEISVIPPGREANPIGTGFAAGTEVQVMLTKEKRDYFTLVLGGDTVANLEKVLGDAASKAREKGIAYKDLTSAFEPTEPTTAAVAATAAKDEAVIPPDLSQLLATAVTSALAPLSEKLDQVAAGLATTQDEVKSLKASDDEKISSRFAARGGPPGTGFVASTDPSTTVRANSTEAKEAEAGLKVVGGPLGELVASAPDAMKPHLEMLGALIGGGH